jgi:formate--tetrahydrofolate ligase
VRLSAGAGFIVAIVGEIMTMSGLPKVPSADVIRFNDAGQIEGLFWAAPCRHDLVRQCRLA